MTYRSKKSIPSPARTAAVLAVSPLPADRLRLREILSPRNWELHEAPNCSEAVAFLRGQRCSCAAVRARSRRRQLGRPFRRHGKTAGATEADCALAPGPRVPLGRKC